MKLQIMGTVVIRMIIKSKRFATNIVRTLYNTVSGKKIAFLGWAFKKDTTIPRICSDIHTDDLLHEQANMLFMILR